MARATTIPESTDASWAGLMVLAQAGDKASYALLLRDCTPMIRRVVRRSLADDNLDAVQEVLLTIHRARHTYDPTRSFTAWVVVTIAQRRTIDLMRKRGRRHLREVYAPAAYENFAADPIDYDRDRSLSSLDQALSDLPPRQREAVEALALRQMSLDEAAHATGNTKGALKVSLHRALKSLSARFGSDE